MRIRPIIALLAVAICVRGEARAEPLPVRAVQQTERAVAIAARQRDLEFLTDRLRGQLPGGAGFPIGMLPSGLGARGLPDNGSVGVRDRLWALSVSTAAQLAVLLTDEDRRQTAVQSDTAVIAMAAGDIYTVTVSGEHGAAGRDPEEVLTVLVALLAGWEMTGQCRPVGASWCASARTRQTTGAL